MTFSRLHRSVLRHYSLAALVLCITSCTAALPEKPFSNSGIHPPERVFRKSYQLGRRQEAFVGQPIASVKDYTVRRAHGPFMTPTASCLVKAAFDEYRIEPGTPYPVRTVVTVEGRDYSVVELMVFHGFITLTSNALVDQTGAPYKRLAIRDGDRTVLMSSDAAFSPPDVRFETVNDDIIVDSKAGFVNFELIYAGTDGKSFTLAYREYTPEDLAKPAFAQSLIYPSGSGSIRFKSLQIAVHEVSSERIGYTVLADDLQ